MGYRAWQALGRQVRAGERGISILAPCTYKRTNDEDDAETRVLRGFRVAHVFDVSQTDGKPLPTPAVTRLEGEAPSGLWEALSAQVEATGFTLERHDIAGTANGTTDFGSRLVTVDAGLSPAQAAKTLAHELAHVLLHTGTEYALGCRGRAEVEAESVAYSLIWTGVPARPRSARHGRRTGLRMDRGRREGDRASEEGSVRGVNGHRGP
jgi:antirestriction protein ArdC